ncbi:MAG: 2-iminoacetate synthase ThiH [Oscillospiraceae bacterium]|nr:2-iminoacetate synthase ThiH [Oscillospiraceae bacterium]
MRCETPEREAIPSDILDKTRALARAYDPAACTAADVRNALGRDTLTFYDYGALLSPAAEPFLEETARRARAETRRQFGTSVSLFTPLYIANYCDNLCAYCGFQRDNPIARARLTPEEIEAELRAIAQTGLREILLLTGESRRHSDPGYIGAAVRLAKRYFSAVGLEIYPLNTDEYARLRQDGADFVSVYQETYDEELYEKVHVSGPKRAFSYRFHAQERAVLGGMRGVSFGALLGLGDFRRDAFAAGLHAFFFQQKYPRAEISFSVPRIRAYANNAALGPRDVGERQLLQVMLAYRLFMPFAAITISTRERPGFRDHAVGLAATRISAGVSVGVGGHGAEQKGEAQFEISDGRSVAHIHEMLLSRGLQPVYTDYIAL